MDRVKIDGVDMHRKQLQRKQQHDTHDGELLFSKEVHLAPSSLRQRL
ncbi:MAG: hypothetical protein RL336_641 [Pseudomonadota bacterium]